MKKKYSAFPLINSYATPKELARKRLRNRRDGWVIQVEHNFYLFLDPERSR